ncbi:MAG TPA: hypothetical protein VIV40_39820 [Kofleriaceae bacterium]
MRRITREWAVGVLAVVAAASLSGCFKGDFANCKVTCATSADCPGDLQCNAQSICSPGGNACSATPDADLTKPQPLTVVKTGDGTITSNPAGIDCGTTCMAEFPPLSSVTLTVAPAATSVFDGWTGDCTGSTSTCSLTMDGPKTANAKFALHGDKRWVKQISFSGQDFVGSELEVDANGDVIAAGAITDQGMNGFYVVKYAKDTGEIIWDKKFLIDQYFFYVGGLDTDSAGNVYMCARMQGNGSPTTIGTSSVLGDLFGNVLAVRFAASTGSVDWAKSWGGDSQEECEGLAVSGTDLFVTGGTSSMPAMFDGVSLTGSTNYGYIVKASTANGTATTGRVLAATFDITDIAENAGQIAIAGRFSGVNYNLDTCNMSSSGSGFDGMIMNFTNNLVCSWAKNYGSLMNGQDTRAAAIAPVPGGGWVTTGSFVGSVNIAGAGSSLTNQGMSDVFVAKFAANGSHVWSFGYGTAGNDAGAGIAVTPTGETVVSGFFSNTIAFGNFSLTTTNTDMFITRMTPGATPIHDWAIKLGGTAFESVQALSVDGTGTVTALAYWTGMTDVAGTPLTAQDYDAWVGSFVR